MELTALAMERIRIQTRRCHNRVATALNQGIIERPTDCAICGKHFNPDSEEGKTQPEAHHPNYNEPLQVIWCCTSCHHKIHGEIRQRLRREAKR